MASIRQMLEEHVEHTAAHAKVGCRWWEGHPQLARWIVGHLGLEAMVWGAMVETRHVELGHGHGAARQTQGRRASCLPEARQGVATRVLEPRQGVHHASVEHPCERQIDGTDEGLGESRGLPL